MRNIKKIVTVATATAMTMAMSFSAMAASLTTSESEVIQALKNANLPSSQIQQVQNYLLKDGVDLTAEQASVIETKVAESQAIVREAGGVNKLSPAQLQSIVTKAEEAGKAVNVSVKFDASTGTVSAQAADGTSVVDYKDSVLAKEGLKNSDNGVVVTSPAGETETVNNGSGAGTSDNGIIKSTGADSMAVTYGVVAVLVAALAGCGVITFKKKTVEK